MNEIDDILAEMISGNEIPEAAKEIVQDWVKASGRNARFYRQAMALGEQRSVFGEATPETVFFEEIQRDIHRKRRSVFFKRFAVAASALILVGFSGYLYINERPALPEHPSPEYKGGIVSSATLTLPDGTTRVLDRETEYITLSDSTVRLPNRSHTLIYESLPDAHRVEWHTLQVPTGAEHRVLLADGTSVLLNSGTTLRYPSAFTGECRRVEIEGEGYFEVADNPGKPFIVHTGSYDIKVVGTSFNVHSYPQNGQVVTTLEEGKVEILAGARTHRLLPGDQAVWDKNTGEMRLQKVDTELYTSWRNGYYYFRQTPLEEIMTTLSLWYGLSVVYTHEEVKAIRFSGRLERTEDASYLFDKFEETNAITFTLNNNHITISKKRTD